MWTQVHETRSGHTHADTHTAPASIAHTQASTEPPSLGSALAGTRAGAPATNGPNTHPGPPPSQVPGAASPHITPGWPHTCVFTELRRHLLQEAACPGSPVSRGLCPSALPRLSCVWGPVLLCSTRALVCLGACAPLPCPSSPVSGGLWPSALPRPAEGVMVFSLSPFWTWGSLEAGLPPISVPGMKLGLSFLKNV